ncbi:MAG: NAD(P)H-hydrate epimerase [Lachnospiraceae bacterium]|nr:NAD(P)H-hydrate epimerase [Lachnospiraceae bacterium]
MDIKEKLTEDFHVTVSEYKNTDKIISVELMRKSDAYTIENFVPGKELMYRAAMGVFNAYDKWDRKKIAIAVGGGNNGGDGYALAGILKKNNIDSVLIRVSDKMSEDGKYYFDIADKLGVCSKDFNEKTNFADFDIIVDCILGTGFTGEVRGKAYDAIKAINQSSAYVISVDINSGMNGDTGEATAAVVSDLTVSIGFVKTGLVNDEAKKYIKKLVNADIGILLVE